MAETELKISFNVCRQTRDLHHLKSRMFDFSHEPVCQLRRLYCGEWDRTVVVNAEEVRIWKHVNMSYFKALLLTAHLYTSYCYSKVCGVLYCYAFIVFHTECMQLNHEKCRSSSYHTVCLRTVWSL